MTRFKGKPRAGSRGFSPRKRAHTEAPRIRNWPIIESGRLLGFAGYKAGMTHAMTIDDLPHSSTKGQEIFAPLTVVECPPLVLFGARAYKKTPYGLKILTETHSDKPTKFLEQVLHSRSNPRFLEEAKDADLVRALVHTQPDKVTGVPKKLPDVMETAIAGTKEEQLKIVQENMGKEITIDQVFKKGELLDVVAVTTGHGMQGPVKRWGVKMLKRKQRHGKQRHVGTLGGRGSHTKWTIPMAGQTGYHRRTEYNKRIMEIGTDSSKINPQGGFSGYGEVRTQYILIKGTIPGPSKRLIRLRHALRPKRDFKIQEPQLTYVSQRSKQGA